MIVACVRTGEKYPVKEVHRLQQSVARHLDEDHRFYCLTDRPQDLTYVNRIDISGLGLPGWWGKMAMFRSEWREGHKVIYLDLDLVITGDLSPLLSIEKDFAICDNFARRSGNRGWPCRYNSSVMIFGPDCDGELFDHFWLEREGLMRANKIFGDQKVIEELFPSSPLIQDYLPEGFFLGWRELYKDHRDKKPEGCSVVVFAGQHKSDRDDVPEWIKEELLQ